MKKQHFIYTPMAGRGKCKAPMKLRDRIKRWFIGAEGEGRIRPTDPWGSWAGGWHEAVYPTNWNKKDR